MSGTPPSEVPGSSRSVPSTVLDRLGPSFAQRRAERLTGRLELLQRGRLLDELEVDDALAERVERVAPHDRVQRHAGLAGARADLADELALQGLLVQLALARDHGAARAH